MADEVSMACAVDIPEQEQNAPEEPTRPTILVVDDDEAIRILLKRWLEIDGFAVETVAGGHEAREKLTQLLPDAICLDLHMPDVSGLTVLQEIRASHDRLPVVVVTTESQTATIVDAMRKGAFDYITKPIDRTRLSTVLRNAAERHQMAVRLDQLQRRAEGPLPFGMIGESKSMTKLFDLIEKVSSSDVTVLVRGESGTGKDLVARAIHERSRRAHDRFVAVNCAAIPETLMESEMFGHEKGAFTGAVHKRVGRFEEADGGTLFLDEVAELPLPLQAKLLRVLETRTFRRVGGAVDLRSDFRLVAATHQDLEGAVAAKKFREDLFYRLAVFELECPALRHRGDDVLTLARHFVRRQAPDRTLSLSRAAERLIANYAWPGNIRELQNAIQRSVVAATTDTLDISDFPKRIQETVNANPTVTPDIDTSDDSLSLAEIERRAILSAWKKHSGNIGPVVAELGIGRTTLYRRLKEYGIT